MRQASGSGGSACAALCRCCALPTRRGNLLQSSTLSADSGRPARSTGMDVHHGSDPFPYGRHGVLSHVGRTRWRIENNVFRTLKAHNGMRLEHNYGHGKRYLHETLTHTTLTAFQRGEIQRRYSEPHCTTANASVLPLGLHGRRHRHDQGVSAPVGIGLMHQGYVSFPDRLVSGPGNGIQINGKGSWSLRMSCNRLIYG